MHVEGTNGNKVWKYFIGAFLSYFNGSLHIIKIQVSLCNSTPLPNQLLLFTSPFFFLSHWSSQDSSNTCVLANSFKTHFNQAIISSGLLSESSFHHQNHIFWAMAEAPKTEDITHLPTDQLQGLEYCIDSNPSWGM